MAAQSVALYLRIRTPNGWSFAKAAFTKQNLPRPLYAVVNGTHEHHPEGVYHLRFRQGGKRMWQPIGKDASLAIVQLQNKATEIQTGEPVPLEPTTQIVDSVSRPVSEPKPEAESGNLTLAAAMTKYLEQTRVHKSRKTFLAYRVTLVLYAEYRTAIKLTRKERSNAEDIKRVISALGNTPVTVTKDDLLDYVAFLKERGNGARTRRNRVDHLQIFLHWTGQQSVLTKNNLPKYTLKKVVAYSQSTIEKMLEHATVDEADLLMFLLCTGVREAEAASACWTDIDLDAKIHKVTEHLNLDYVPKDKEEGNVQLPDVLIERLRVRRARMPHSRLIFPKSDGKPNGHLLRIIKQLGLRAGANCGHCVNKRGLSCAKHPVCSHIILHKLRKTFATRMHKSGTSARTIMRLLRHSDLQTTLAYLADQDEAEVFEASNKAFAGFGGAA